MVCGGVTRYFRVNALPRWRPCGTFWRMAKRLRAHSTRLILDWPPLGAYIAPTCYSSTLAAIINPIKGPRAIRKSTSSTVLLRGVLFPFLLFFFPFFPSFSLCPPFLALLSFLSFALFLAFVCGFGNSKLADSDRSEWNWTRLRESGRFVEQRSFPELSLFAVLLAPALPRELFNLLPCCSFEDVFLDQPYRPRPIPRFSN